MTDLKDRLRTLSALPAPQLNELIYRLDVPETYLPGPNTEPITRVIAILKFLEQRELGIAQLDQALRQLRIFKEFHPRGLLRVGAELRVLEEEREHNKMQAAVMSGEDPEHHRVTPERFYTFKSDAAWLGLFRGWDAERSFHKNILEIVEQGLNGPGPCIAAIVGHGGAGKSVALRRLGLDLAALGKMVWLVEHQQLAIDYGLPDLLALAAEQELVILIDEAQWLDGEAARQLIELLVPHSRVFLIIAGRKIPASLRRLIDHSHIFVPDEAKDQCLILTKIAATQPTWASMAEALKAEELRKARLIRLLVVLAHGRVEVPKNLNELEQIFLTILAEDLSRICEHSRGLAEELLAAAFIQSTGYHLSRSSIIALADHWQPGAGLRDALQTFRDNRRWGDAKLFVSLDETYDVVAFHHDELATGLIQAVQEIKRTPIIDDHWKKNVVILLSQHGSDYSSSYAFSGVLRMWPHLFSEPEKKEIFMYLIKRKNSHHAYFHPLFMGEIQLSHEQTEEILVKSAKFSQDNTYLWGDFAKWLTRNAMYRDDKIKLVDKLWSTGLRVHTFVQLFLDLATPGRARKEAQDLLKAPGTHPHVQCKCLEVLGRDAAEEARSLLKAPGTYPEVQCKCLEVLGRDAAEKARSLLKAPGTHPHVQCKCLEVLGRDAAEEARSLLKAPGTYPEVQCKCLEVLGRDAAEKARSLLKAPGTHPHVQCKCLEVLGRDAAEEARSLLKAPGTYPEVQCKCLEVLGRDAAEKARSLLKAEGTHPHVQCKCLEVLGRDAAEEARCLLKAEGTYPQVQCKCLEVLGRDAAEEARCLLKAEGTTREVLVASLNVLGSGGREQAVNLLRRPSLHPEVRARCFEVFYYESDEIDEVCRAQLIELIRDPRADSEARCRALDLLASDAEALAADLLEIDAKHQCAEVQRHCLQLLGQKARRWADKWYAIDDISPTVRSACLDIVGQDALPFAKHVLAQWRKWDSKTVEACLRIAGATDEAKAAVREMRENEETLSSLELYMQVWVPSLDAPQPHNPAPRDFRDQTLSLDFHTPWLLTRKRQVLNNWFKLLSIDGNRADPDFLPEFVVALLTPSLRDHAEKTVKAMLLWEKYRSGALSPELIQLLRQLDEGNWPTISQVEVLLEQFARKLQLEQTADLSE